MGARRPDAGVLFGRHLVLSAWGSRGRTSWPIAMAGANSGDGRPSFRAQRSARSAAGRGTWASTSLRPMSSKWPYCTPLGQVVSQLRQVRQRSRCAGSCASGHAFEHLFHQVNAAARAVQLVAQQLVGGAGGGAKTAVHAFAQNGFGRLAVGRVLVLGREMGLHGCSSSEVGVHAPRVEDARRIKFGLQRRWMRSSAGSMGKICLWPPVVAGRDEHAG